jgi:DNA-binding MarR family transcriptional regulator
MDEKSISSRFQEDFDPVTIHIVKCLRKITHEIGRYSKHIHENYRITLPQVICLREIGRHGPISFSDLTKLIFLNNSTVTGIVDRLEKHNLVKRVRSSNDRRQIHLEITEEGLDLLEHAPPPIDSTFIKNLKDLDQEEINQIIWSLEKIIKMFNTTEEFTPFSADNTPTASPG